MRKSGLIQLRKGDCPPPPPHLTEISITPRFFHLHDPNNTYKLIFETILMEPYPYLTLPLIVCLEKYFIYDLSCFEN